QEPGAPLIFLGGRRILNKNLQGDELLVGDVLDRERDRRDQFVLAVDDTGVEPAGADVLELEAGGEIDRWSASRRQEDGDQDERGARAHSVILEHLLLHALDRLLARKLSRSERGEVAAAQAEDDRRRLAVERPDPGTSFVLARANRQPLIGAET